MNKLKIIIGSDYMNETDEMRKLTIDLKDKLEEIEIENIEYEKSEEVERGKGDLIEWGNLILPLVFSPEVTIALIATLRIWLKSKVDKTIAKTLKIEINDKKYELTGYSDDELVKILNKLNLGE